MSLHLVHDNDSIVAALARALGPPVHYANTDTANDTLAVSVRRLERFLDHGGEFGACAIHRVGPTDWECRPLHPLGTRGGVHEPTVGRGITLHDCIDDLVGVYAGHIRAS